MSVADAKFRVWWIPQVPMKAFYVYVSSLREASLICDTLAEYDDFQFANNVKGDYSNAGGLEVLEDGEWVEWESEHGDDFRTHCETQGWSS